MIQNIKKWFPKNVKKYKNTTACVEAFADLSGYSIRHSWKLFKELGNPLVLKDATKTAKNTLKNNVPGSITLKDMINKFDVPKMIQDGIKNLGSTVIYDDDFRRYLKLSLDKWRRASSLKIFDINKLQRSNNKVVWGCKESIKQIIKTIDIVE